MKRVMSIALVALFAAGTSAFACESCGCTAQKEEVKQECAKESSCASKKKACASEKKACASEKKACASESSCSAEK